MSDLPRLHVGDHVTDREDDDATMLVVGLDTMRADAYELGNGGTTVADVNEAYPETDDVVEVVFPSRTDMDVDTKRYAYPRSRLKRTKSIHDVGDDIDALADALDRGPSDDLGYLLTLAADAEQEADEFDSREAATRWVVAAWCQELRYVPDLRDYLTGQTVPMGEVPACGPIEAPTDAEVKLTEIKRVLDEEEGDR